jgi:hypothetical protein
MEQTVITHGTDGEISNAVKPGTLYRWVFEVIASQLVLRYTLRLRRPLASLKDGFHCTPPAIYTRLLFPACTSASTT